MTTTNNVKCRVNLRFKNEAQASACYDFMASKKVENLEKGRGIDLYLNGMGGKEHFFVSGVFYGTQSEVAKFKNEATALIPKWREL